MTTAQAFSAGFAVLVCAAIAVLFLTFETR